VISSEVIIFLYNANFDLQRKGVKENMQKLFRLTALLIAAMLVVWVAGCGDDDDDDDDAEPAASVVNVAPADGSTVPANQKVTVDFDNAVDSCTINGKPATLSGGNKKAEVADAGLTEGQSNTVTIAWTNKDGSSGSSTVTYTVQAADTEAPELTGGNVEDGDDGLSPDELNADGIELEFNEEIDSVSLELSVEGTALNWKFSKDGTKVAGVPLSGADLGFEKEYVIEGTVADAAGNEADISITFATEAKEE
jgi:hypothetical protein